MCSESTILSGPLQSCRWPNYSQVWLTQIPSRKVNASLETWKIWPLLLEGQIINETYHTEAGLVSSGSPTDSPPASNVSPGDFVGAVPMDNKDISVLGNNPLEVSLGFSATLCTCPQDATCHSEFCTTRAAFSIVLRLIIWEGVSWTTASWSADGSAICVDTKGVPLGDSCAVVASSLKSSSWFGERVALWTSDWFASSPTTISIIRVSHH